jgi:hypothetical protein
MSKAFEEKLRRNAARERLALQKKPRGGYRIIDLDGGAVLAGDGYTMSLDEAGEWLFEERTTALHEAGHFTRH